MIELLDGSIAIVKNVKPQDDFTLENLTKYDEYMEVD